MRRALAAAALGALLVAGYVLGLPATPTTLAGYADAAAGGGTFRASIPLERTCVLWAHAGALHLAGHENRYDGCLHGNGDVRVVGSAARVESVVRHAGELTVAPQNVLAQGAQRVEAAQAPYVFDLAALAARATRHEDGARFDATTPDGVHHVAGDALVELRGEKRWTIVAEGRLLVVAHGGAASPAADGLVFAALGEGEALQLSGERASVRGAWWAPAGRAHVAGAEHALEGWIGGADVEVSARGATFTAENPLASR